MTRVIEVLPNEYLVYADMMNGVYISQTIAKEVLDNGEEE